MKKSGGGVLQIEVNTEEEWQQLLDRAGLIVADVYSEWSGPCTAMTSTLKAIKMEIGGDAVDFAIARNDDIDDLARFRGRSEPTWMFLQDGKMVNLIFGAHRPYLKKQLIDEIRRVQQSEPPRWRLSVRERVPEEEVRWQRQEAIRIALEEEQRAREEAERLEKYERFMAQMMLELCEETALVLYPWVFKDEETGKPREKSQCPPYAELVQDLFKQCFDVQEETRIQLNDEMIKKMFVESDVEITEELMKGLTDGKCMAMRMKGKPPHPSWPVIYPYECPDPSKKCPTRAIDDVENYLISIITTEPPPLIPSDGDDEERPTYDAPYVERHVFEHEPDPEVEGDVRRVHPAAWVPPQARSKVHVFKTLFPAYMEKAHPYEEPAPPLPFCAFKFEASKFGVVRDAYEAYSDAVEYFGAFEYDRPPYAKRLVSSPADFETKVTQRTDLEVFVLIVRRINEEVFLTFAGIEPLFVTEDDEIAQKMIMEYFPKGAKDVMADDGEDEGEDYEEEAETDKPEED